MIRVTVLGSGTSQGVPAIGCDCDVCRSSDPRDRRTRPSILIEITPVQGPASSWSGFAGAGPLDPSIRRRPPPAGARQRRLGASTPSFTHTHADHVFGIDDCAVVMQKAAIRASPTRTRWRACAGCSRIARAAGQVGGGLPQLTLFRDRGLFSLGGVESWCRFARGRSSASDRSFAYLTDQPDPGRVVDAAKACRRSSPTRAPQRTRALSLSQATSLAPGPARARAHAHLPRSGHAAGARVLPRRGTRL
jgi:hypothetical protein